jgi:energy-coupling factor transporter transmembrane protein EcfT
MIDFLKKRFGYGLAGFVYALILLTLIIKVFRINNIPDKYLLLAPIGFVLGLAFPKLVGNLFMNMIAGKSGSKGSDLDPEEIQKGRSITVIYIFGLLMLCFLVWIIIKSF